MVTRYPRPVTSVDPRARSIRLESPDASAAVLLAHGFTGTPASMRPWAEHLHGAGFTTVVPRLPGHGTSWQEMNLTRWQDWYLCLEQEYLALRRRWAQVFVAGLSMGGALALRLAQHHPELPAVAVVNPSIGSADPQMKVLPVLKHLVASVSGVGSDIARPDVTELTYDRTPLHAADSLRDLWADVSAQLTSVRCPLLVFHSRTDHVVDDTSVTLLSQALAGTGLLEVVPLPRSFHVATMDYDAEQIFTGSTQFFSSRMT